MHVKHSLLGRVMFKVAYFCIDATVKMSSSLQCKNIVIS